MRRRIGATNIAKKKMNGSAPNASPSRGLAATSAGGGSGSPSIKPISASTPSFTPRRVVAVVEPRHDALGDHALRERVRHGALEPVADLDPQLAVVFRDHEHDAVVGLAAADLPRLGDAQRIGLDRFGRRRRHQQHGELRAFARLERRELLLERRALRRASASR